MDEEGSIREHFCHICNQITSFEGEIGSFFCMQCGSQTQDLIITTDATDDIFGEEAGGTGLYSQNLHRHLAPKQEPDTGELFDVKADDKPRDFGLKPDIFTMARAIRSRYIDGLQAMLQRQCEVLMETFKVSPLVCGMAPTIWLRYLAIKGVYKEGWDASVIADFKDQQAKRAKGKNLKSKLEDANIKFILRTLRKLIPIYSTVAVSFLLCHLAREPVLPTDIIEWALEAKLPYLSFFTEMDRYIGTATVACPLKNRSMFRPALLLGSWQLEVVVGKIAQQIGLQLPPVNFYAVARRWLEELNLPMKILPHACRAYEWLLPAELWISGKNLYGFPTRVVVMSVMIIILRKLYGINGYGTWEKSLSSVTDKEGPQEDVTMGSDMSSEFDARELLRVLEAVHKDLEVKHGYLKDVNSYLKYYKEVISAEMSLDSNMLVNKMIRKCSNIYNNEDDSDIKPVNLEHKDIDGRRYTNVESSTHLNSDNFEKDCSLHKIVVDPSFRKERELDRMRFEMEQNQFCYLPPLFKMKLKGYISYRRVNRDKHLIYAVHADYYILLRAMAKVARIDMRLLHACTLEMERKLVWAEENIRTCLNVPKNQSEGGPTERQEAGLDGPVEYDEHEWN